MNEISRCIVTVLAMVAFFQSAVTKASSQPRRLAKEDRAIVLAIDLEVHANHLEARSNICLGFGNGLTVNESAILAELNHRGLKLHTNEWRNRGPRGVVISIIYPVDKLQPGTYKFVVELGDLESIRRGEHFGAIVRRGTYVVQVQDRREPELIGYQKTCCSEETASP